MKQEKSSLYLLSLAEDFSLFAIAALMALSLFGGVFSETVLTQLQIGSFLCLSLGIWLFLLLYLRARTNVSLALRLIIYATTTALYIYLWQDICIGEEIIDTTAFYKPFTYISCFLLIALAIGLRRTPKIAAS